MSESTAVSVQGQQGTSIAAPSNPLGAGAQSMIDYVAAIASPAALRAAKDFANAYNAVCEALIGDDDMQRAEGNKYFKKKSAWRKLGRHFGVSTEIVHKERGWETDERTGDRFYYAEVHVRGTAPWGQFMVAVGACDTRESRFTGRNSAQALAKMGNDVLATAETRATNRAISNLIAAGEVSAEEVQGGYAGGEVEAQPAVVLASDAQVAELRELADKIHPTTRADLDRKVEMGLPASRVVEVYTALERLLTEKQARKGRKGAAQQEAPPVVVDPDADPMEALYGGMD